MTQKQQTKTDTDTDMKKQHILPLAITLLGATPLYADQNQSMGIINHTFEPRSVRNIMGSDIPIQHAKGQLRLGYITLNNDSSELTTSAYALGGHFHLDTKRWNGLEVGLSAYTVLNLGINQNPLHVNPDFFNDRGKSFIILSEAYLDGKWGGTEIKLGRQILDTPHADSDDIRMIPNYFEAYTFTNTDIDNLALMAGFIRTMGGWENGVDASRFVRIYETLGSDEATDGVYYASAVYEGIDNLTLSLWYYNFKDIADIVYAEAGYSYTFSDNFQVVFGVQYDSARESGAAFCDMQDSDTFGVSFELVFEQIGIHILGAYNEDNGASGATGFSLGGGPFFTSMEDQTLDAVGAPGKAWMLGGGYHFSTIGIDGLDAGIAYGHFEADNASHYESHETDAVIEYSYNDTLTLTAAFSDVVFEAGKDDDGKRLQDFRQFRFVMNYSL